MDPLAPFQTITRTKEFKDPDIAVALAALNLYVSGTLEPDPDHAYNSRVAAAYWDGTNNVVILEYSYVIAVALP